MHIVPTKKDYVLRKLKVYFSFKLLIDWLVYVFHENSSKEAAVPAGKAVGNKKHPLPLPPKRTHFYAFSSKQNSIRKEGRQNFKEKKLISILLSALSDRQGRAPNRSSDKVKWKWDFSLHYLLSYFFVFDRSLGPGSNWSAPTSPSRWWRYSVTHLTDTRVLKKRASYYSSLWSLQQRDFSHWWWTNNRRDCSGKKTYITLR